jgi:hypothetical protein
MIGNILFYVKNLIFKWGKTPKEIRYFTCFICKEDFSFPLYSKDYVVCNSCFDKI